MVINDYLCQNTGQWSSAPHSAIPLKDIPTSYLPFLLTIHSTMPGKNRRMHIETELLFELGLVKFLAHKY